MSDSLERFEVRRSARIQPRALGRELEAVGASVVCRDVEGSLLAADSTEIQVGHKQLFAIEYGAEHGEPEPSRSIGASSIRKSQITASSGNDFSDLGFDTV